MKNTHTDNVYVVVLIFLCHDIIFMKGQYVTILLFFSTKPSQNSVCVCVCKATNLNKIQGVRTATFGEFNFESHEFV